MRPTGNIVLNHRKKSLTIKDALPGPDREHCRNSVGEKSDGLRGRSNLKYETPTPGTEPFKILVVNIERAVDGMV